MSLAEERRKIWSEALPISVEHNAGGSWYLEWLYMHSIILNKQNQFFFPD